jgi:hypothetical protein
MSLDCPVTVQDIPDEYREATRDLADRWYYELVHQRRYYDWPDLKPTLQGYIEQIVLEVLKLRADPSHRVILTSEAQDAAASFRAEQQEHLGKGRDPEQRQKKHRNDIVDTVVYAIKQIQEKRSLGEPADGQDDDTADDNSFVVPCDLFDVLNPLIRLSKCDRRQSHN